MTKENIAGKIIKQDPDFPESNHNSEQDSLHQIIAGCREYDIHSQERLYKKFYGYALGIALAYCPTREDALEVVNDSFLKVFKRIKTFRTSENFKPWFRQVVVNTAIDKARANKRFNQHVEIVETRQASPVDIESELYAKQIYNLLNELPELLRFVFNMYEIEGYSHKEISQKLEIAESSSRTYLTRAKTRLRELYRNLYLVRNDENT